MNRFNLSAIILAVGILAAGPHPAAGEAADGYHVAKTIHVGGEGRWDYVNIDPRTKMLYVPRQSHTQVINAQTGAILGDLKDTPGVHGVALAPDLDRGFTSNGQGKSVTVFDLKTLNVLGTVPAGEGPDAIIYDPGSKKVLAMNGRSRDVTVIDAAAEPGPAAAIARVPLDGRPEFAAADGKGRVYVNLEDKSSVAVIDTNVWKVLDVWKIEGGDGPSGLAIDAANGRLFAGCGNQVMAVLDTHTGKTLATLPIGNGVDACGFDAESHEAFASCGDGTLTVAKETAPGKFEVVQKVQTRRGARTMTLDPTTHTVYLPTAEFDQPAPGQRRPPMKPGSFMIVVVSKLTQ